MTGSSIPATPAPSCAWPSPPSTRPPCAAPTPGAPSGIEASLPMTLRTVLIANRGEIARRIRRTCHALGLRAVAVYSEADRDLPFVREADLALCIGEPAPERSYLNID